MAYQANEITILKNDELTLLLAAAGIGRWYGIDTGNTSELESDGVFNRNLASLYQKHIVDWQDGKAHIAAPYRHFLHVIRSSSICITAESPGRPGYVKGSYFNMGNVVIIERRTAACDEIEVSVRKYDDWLKDLEEDGMIPETAGIPEADELMYIDKELISHFELRSEPGGGLLETMDIYEKGVYGIIERKKNDETFRGYFTKDRFIAVLKSWTGGCE